MRAALLFSGLLAAFTATAGAWQDPQTPPAQPKSTTDRDKNAKKPVNSGQPPDATDAAPDPTKDPMKDPALDITRDPQKDPPKDSDPSKTLGGDDPTGGLQAPDYTGPAILSRGYSLTRPTVPTDEKFAVYLGMNATYDSGLIGAYIQNGQVPSISTAGADLNWGINGRHYRRKDIFEINYSGHYYEYAANSKYSGQDESLSLGYTRQLTPRLSIGIRENAGLYSNTYSVLNSTALNDTSLASATLVVAPNTESFDDRTYFTTTQGSLVWQKTARLSFSVAAANFLVRRNSLELADSNGYQTSFDMAYRWTKRQTIGTYYTHSAYTFRKQFGETNADSVGANYSISLSRNMDLSVRAGGTKLETQALGTVIPNPLVQAVLGITTGVEKEYFVGYAPDITVTLNRRLKKSSLGAAFTEGITPGNGLILTSRRESESVYYTLPTFRKYAMQIGAGRDKLDGYINSPGTYTSYYGRFSVSRPVMRDLSSIFSFDFRKYAFSFSGFQQTEYRLSVGLRYTPGDRPLKFW